MPQGVHKSIRVALAIPPKLHEQLSAWADYEGRPVASLCAYLVENSLRQAQKEGIAPSFRSEEEGESGDAMDKYEFDGVRNVRVGIGPFKKDVAVKNDMTPEQWEAFKQFSEQKAKEQEEAKEEKSSKEALLQKLMDVLKD